MNKNFIGLMILALLAVSCVTIIVPNQIEVDTVPIDQSIGTDSSLQALLDPFKMAMESEMGEAVAFAATDFIKAQPSSPLGNWICDALQESFKEDYRIDFTIQNYGGIRIPQLDSGTITRGKIFEMLPFENFMTLVEMKGSVVKLMLGKIAKNGGWPSSTNLMVEIKSDSIVRITINTEPISDDRTYSVLMNDYVAAGGDKMDMLIEESKENTGVLIRDGILTYLENQAKELNRSNADLPPLPILVPNNHQSFSYVQ